jgi:hypothetical protein
MTSTKFEETIKYFEDEKHAEISTDGKWIWQFSGIWHSLNKGKFSKKQLTSVQRLLLFHDFPPKFPNDWPSRVRQLYVVKYSLVIPIPNLTESDTDTDTESDRKKGELYKKFK